MVLRVVVVIYVDRVERSSTAWSLQVRVDRSSCKVAMMESYGGFEEKSKGWRWSCTQGVKRRTTTNLDLCEEKIAIVLYIFGIYISTKKASGELDTDKFPAGYEGSKDKDQSHQRESLSSNELLKRLKRYGVSGILAYGLLNTAYYLTTFLLVWFYVVPAPGKMGYLAAVQRFLKIMAMVWAGSQVTKLVRAGGALALAPFADRGLSWFAMKYKFESQGKDIIRNE